MKKTLGEWQEAIKRQIPFVDVKPYSHNIISCCLRGIAKDYGNEIADNTIKELKLNKLGWNIKRG